MEIKIKKEFDAVKMAREIKDELHKKLSGMTKSEIVNFFKEQRSSSERVLPGGRKAQK